jgi:hypothetical protein
VTGLGRAGGTEVSFQVRDRGAHDIVLGQVGSVVMDPIEVGYEPQSGPKIKYTWEYVVRYVPNSIIGGGMGIWDNVKLCK